MTPCFHHNCIIRPCPDPAVREVSYTSPATCNVVRRVFCDFHAEAYEAGLPEGFIAKPGRAA